MNALLLLAADLVDQAADLRHGDAANEMAAWRLEEALDVDGALRSRLLEGSLIDDQDDLDTMRFGSWLWVLSWRQRHDAHLDEAVLRALTPRATSADRRLRLRTLVGRDPLLEREVGSIDEYLFRRPRRLPLPWLADQVAAASAGRMDPYELMRHLLQIGTDVTLATLVELLEAPGEHQEALREEVRRGLGPDPDLRDLWLHRLGLDGDRP
jgi:hypothetical protein